MKQTPIQFAQEFINNLKTESNIDISKDNNVIFSKDVIDNDPNLEILKSELARIGYTLIPNEKVKYCFVLRKLP